SPPGGLSATTRNQHLDAQMQPLTSLKSRQSPSNFLAHGTPRRIGQGQVDLRDLNRRPFDRLPIRIKAFKTAVPRFSFDPNIPKPCIAQQSFQPTRVGERERQVNGRTCAVVCRAAPAGSTDPAAPTPHSADRSDTRCPRAGKSDGAPP